MSLVRWFFLGCLIHISIWSVLFSCSSRSQNKQETFEQLLYDGEKYYIANCSVCHQINGLGVPQSFPPLSQTDWVTGNKQRLINIVLKGIQEKIKVHGEIYDAVMPAQDSLSDAKIASILTYIRNSFGNQASPVWTNEVKKVRHGGTLVQEKTDFADVKPSNDYDKRKKLVTSRIESRVGLHFEKGKIRTDQIVLPPGFSLEVYVSGLENPRSLALGPNGTLFIGTRRNEGDFIYAITDKNNDWQPDTIIRISKGLKWDPMGVAIKDNDLYVGEIDRILRYRNIEEHLYDPPQPELIFNYPPEKKHGHKYIRFGPDGKLYVPVGAPCNNCLEENPVFASITRINPDGIGFEIFAHGVRNSRGFDWHPETGELWFSDNGRDHLGDDIPPCEINIAPEAGLHFGFPYCHGKRISDPEFGSLKPCSDFTSTTFDLDAHTAPVSLMFINNSSFPGEYQGRILVTEHGSWNRTKKQGYRIMMLTIEEDEVTGYKPFAEGWLDEKLNDAWGRPVDILQMPDGSLLVSDDYAGAVYRISFKNEVQS